MYVIYHGVYGIENIKTVNKHRLRLQELNIKYGDMVWPDSHEKYKELLIQINI